MPPLSKARARIVVPPATENASAVRAAEQFLPLLCTADAGAIARMMIDTPSIDQPLWGLARGRAEVRVMVTRAGGWLADRRAQVRDVAITSNGDRTVVEQVLRLVIDGKAIELPVAVVVVAEGESVSTIRTYHSTWPLTGAHAVRPPLLAQDANIVVPGLLGGFLRALHAGDVEGILASYEDDGYARESSGGEYVHRGKARLRLAHTMQLMTGGIPLEFCTLTDDGLRCAIEYNFVRWGKTEVLPQAGIAVYERGMTGRVAAARVYDDVNPPGARP